MGVVVYGFFFCCCSFGVFSTVEVDDDYIVFGIRRLYFIVNRVVVFIFGCFVVEFTF